jgi:CheY-like chemotaxis protein
MLNDTRILVVGDDARLARMCTSVLGGVFGASVITATASEAAAVAAAFAPHAILCDVGRPDGSVDDLRERVGGLLEPPLPPLFVMSGEDHADRYRQPEVAGFFLKPTRMSTIASAIAAALYHEAG